MLLSAHRVCIECRAVKIFKKSVLCMCTIIAFLRVYVRHCTWTYDIVCLIPNVDLNFDKESSAERRRKLAVRSQRSHLAIKVLDGFTREKLQCSHLVTML